MKSISGIWLSPCPPTTSVVWVEGELKVSNPTSYPPHTSIYLPCGFESKIHVKAERSGFLFLFFWDPLDPKYSLSALGGEVPGSACSCTKVLHRSLAGVQRHLSTSGHIILFKQDSSCNDGGLEVDKGKAQVIFTLAPDCQRSIFQSPPPISSSVISSLLVGEEERGISPHSWVPNL